MKPNDRHIFELSKKLACLGDLIRRLDIKIKEYENKEELDINEQIKLLEMKIKKEQTNIKHRKIKDKAKARYNCSDSEITRLELLDVVIPYKVKNPSARQKNEISQVKIETFKEELHIKKHIVQKTLHI